MKVKSVTYNWHSYGSTLDRDGTGDNWERFVVGEYGVVSIEENIPQTAFQVWNYVVNLENGVRYRVFNPNFVEYFSE
jgi:hypothetical protein